eukprot:5536510-Pleurochrysis_carterae.AAC.1
MSHRVGRGCAASAVNAEKAVNAAPSCAASSHHRRCQRRRCPCQSWLPRTAAASAHSSSRPLQSPRRGSKSRADGR